MISSMTRSGLGRSIARALLVGWMVSGCAGGASGVPASPSMAAPSKPTLELELAPEPGAVMADAGRYSADPASTLNVCVESANGYWRVQYSGGDPWFGVDLLVGPTALTEGRSEDVAAEIQVGSPLTTYLWIDQPGHRGGDEPGRSTATVEATETAGAVTFEFAATTPIRTTGGDLDRVDVDLTVVCPATG